MTIQVQLLQSKCKVQTDGSFGPATLKAAALYFGLNREQSAHFFGQCYHESAGFTVFEENLNYSSGGLMKTFPRHFTPGQAIAYAHKPEMIANKVYANRMGNGDELSGDGWKYRGRGAIQLTGKSNYSKFGKNEEEVVTKYAFESAKFFFDEKLSLWSKCQDVSSNSIMLVTKSVNGGTNGLAERTNATLKFYEWLK